MPIWSLILSIATIYLLTKYHLLAGIMGSMTAPAHAFKLGNKKPTTPVPTGETYIDIYNIDAWVKIFILVALGVIMLMKAKQLYESILKTFKHAYRVCRCCCNPPLHSPKMYMYLKLMKGSDIAIVYLMAIPYEEGFSFIFDIPGIRTVSVQYPHTGLPRLAVYWTNPFCLKRNDQKTYTHFPESTELSICLTNKIRKIIGTPGFDAALLYKTDCHRSYATLKIRQDSGAEGLDPNCVREGSSALEMMSGKEAPPGYNYSKSALAEPSYITIANRIPNTPTMPRREFSVSYTTQM
jgi:hypothetical protein